MIDGLRYLAFGDIQDAITLLFESDENILNILPKLDLFNVSEIKRPKGGGMEIKFFDRLKALEKLSCAVDSSEKNKAVSFYEALEKSTSNAENDCGESMYV